MTLPDASPGNKILLLGTALWGWGIDRVQAYDILERFLSLGGIAVDTAANYPIDKNPAHFGLAVAWLAEWVKAHGRRDLSILVKIGAKDNQGGAEADLSAENIRASTDSYRKTFGETLGGIAIHWDHRGGGDASTYAGIAETLDSMAEIARSSLAIGFSGVQCANLYAKARPDLAGQWWIQVKENALTRAAREAYQPFFPKARYLAYGINMGGLKEKTAASSARDSSSLELRGITHADALKKKLLALLKALQADPQVKSAPQTLNELALLISYANPHLSGIILGPRNATQLEASMSYWEKMKKGAVKLDWRGLEGLMRGWR